MRRPCSRGAGFGEHAIADYTAEQALAERYAAAMARRFAGLRITLVVVPPLQAQAPEVTDS